MDGESHRRFYYIVSNVAFGPGQLFHCDACPGDVLQIVYIQNILVHLPLKVQIVTKSEQMYAEVIADNFKQDCKMFNDFGMSYEKYMDRIILNLIEKQNKLTNAIVRPRDYDVESNIVDGVDTNKKDDCIQSDVNASPKLFEIHV